MATQTEKVVDYWMDVQLLGSGYAAVMCCMVKDLRTGDCYPDIWNTGIGRYRTYEEAEREMKSWAKEEDVRIGYYKVVVTVGHRTCSL